jgi:hypothetical protein
VECRAGVCCAVTCDVTGGPGSAEFRCKQGMLGWLAVDGSDAAQVKAHPKVIEWSKTLETVSLDSQ